MNYEPNRLKIEDGSLLNLVETKREYADQFRDNPEALRADPEFRAFVQEMFDEVVEKLGQYYDLPIAQSLIHLVHLRCIVARCCEQYIFQRQDATYEIDITNEAISVFCTEVLKLDDVQSERMMSKLRWEMALKKETDPAKYAELQRRSWEESERLRQIYSRRVRQSFDLSLKV